MCDWRGAGLVVLELADWSAPGPQFLVTVRPGRRPGWCGRISGPGKRVPGRAGGLIVGP